MTADWPALPLAEWRETCETLHMWTQIVGKIRMELSPPRNHWWHSTLYVSPRGLTTSSIPAGNRQFELEFDFIASELVTRVSDGSVRTVDLAPRSVADFHDELFSQLNSLGIDVKIYELPQ